MTDDLRHPPIKLKPLHYGAYSRVLSFSVSAATRPRSVG